MIRQSWWKILGVLMFLYVLVAGMVIPLGSGITDISNVDSSASSYKLYGGETYEFRIQAYNTKYTSSEPKAWIKLDSLHAIPADKINATSDQELVLAFSIPTSSPAGQNKKSATLIIDEKDNGYALVPDAFMIYPAKNEIASTSTWSKDAITTYSTIQPFAFPYRSILNETIRNTFFHVALWFAMFILLIVSLVYSIKYLRTRDLRNDHIAYSFTSVAILFGLLGIATGSIWANFTWGKWWTTDVKLNMSAIAMLIYLAYWLLRSSIKDVDGKARISAAYNIFAFAALIPLVFVIPRMTDSLHPGNGGNPALGGEDLDHTLRMVFYPSVIALSLIGCWIASLQSRMLQVKEKLNETP